MKIKSIHNVNIFVQPSCVIQCMVNTYIFYQRVILIVKCYETSLKCVHGKIKIFDRDILA